MSGTEIAADLLAVAGGACELAGLAIVALGISRDRERARRLLEEPPRRPLPSRDYPGRQSPGMMPPPYANPMFGGGQQLSGVIKHVQRLEASVANVLIGMRKAVDAERDAAIEMLRQEADQAGRDLRESLRYVLVGSIKGRVVGAVILAVGIVLSVAANVVGNAA